MEHTAEASDIMLAHCLRDCGVSKEGSLHVWSDCGPHFRSAENLHFYARTLVEKRKQPVLARWLGEQHGKGVLDQLFGISGTHLGGWIGQHALRQPIHNIEHMRKALQEGADRQVRTNPGNAAWVIRTINYGENKASLRRFLYAESLKITRAYALDAVPAPGSAANLPPILYNRVFAERPNADRTRDWRIEVLETPGEKWRRSFFEGKRDWEQTQIDVHAPSH